MKKTQEFRLKNANPIVDNSFVLISTRYIKKGNKLDIKFNKKGKKLLPGKVIGKGDGNTYPVKVSINYKDLIKNNIYNVDYKLLKEVSKSVYNEIIVNFLLIENIMNSDDDNNNNE